MRLPGGPASAAADVAPVALENAPTVDAFPGHMFIGDLDGDGDVDFVTSFSAAAIGAAGWLSNPAGEGPDWQQHPLGNSPLVSMIAVDLDANGADELVHYDAEFGWIVLRYRTPDGQMATRVIHDGLEFSTVACAAVLATALASSCSTPPPDARYGGAAVQQLGRGK